MLIIIIIIINFFIQVSERILNVCKSSWQTCIVVKWDVDVHYGPIAAKLTA